jgi:CheY-like chemotaxis protein
VLTQAGYQVVRHASGDDLVGTVRRVKPDLIILDYRVGGTDCHELCRQLAREPDLAHIPIVLTGTRADAVGDPVVAGMSIVDRISKPFVAEALLAVVEHTLRKREELLGQPALADNPPELDVDDDDPARRLAARLTAAVSGMLPLGSANEPVSERLARLFDGDELIVDLRALLRGRPAGPCLTGDLTQVTIADVLQMLSLQRQSGILTATCSEASISIAFKDGAVRMVTGENAGHQFLLGAILVRERLMQPGELAVFLQNRQGTRQRLGTQVVRLGYISHEELGRALKRQSSELVYELLRWGCGSFEFYRRADLPQEVLEFDFGITIDELLMEGYRRVDEWHLIESVLPSLDAVLVALPGGLERLGPQGLTSQEQVVYAQVDGKRSAQEVIDQGEGGTFEAARVLYRLLSAHVVGIAGTSESAWQALHEESPEGKLIEALSELDDPALA